MSLIKNTLWNGLGFVIPVLLIVPAFGIIARILNVEQFGLFTLFFTIIGYAGLFDLGMSRAVIRFVAIYQNNLEKIKKVISTSTVVVGVFSSFSSLLIFLFSKSISDYFNVTPDVYQDVNKSLLILAFGIPPLIISTVWFSYLEGLQQFAKLNLVKGISGVLLAILPLGFIAIGKDLVSAVFGLVLARYITLILAYVYSLPSKNIKDIFKYDSSVFKELISFGGWITISNIISPIMIYFDRFIVSSFSGATNVAFYTSSSEAITRLLFVPTSVARVIFPKLSSKSTTKNKDVFFSYLIVATSCLLLVISGYFLSSFAFGLWLGPEYSVNASKIFNILLIGFFFNSLAHIPYAVIQAAGYSKITAYLHIFELLPFLAILYYLTDCYGMAGAAWAWNIRVCFDFLALIFIAKKYN